MLTTRQVIDESSITSEVSIHTIRSVLHRNNLHNEYTATK